MIMRTVAAALVVVGMLTSVALAEQVFFDDFDANAPGMLGALTGHTANTGQVWAGPIYGATDAQIGSGPGVGGTNGISYYVRSAINGQYSAPGPRHHRRPSALVRGFP